MGFAFRLSQLSEPSDLLCRCFCIICPCYRRRRPSTVESVTSVRRISRVRSDDSLDVVCLADKFEDSDEVVSISSSGPTSSPEAKFPKKISFRSIATKAMKKSHSSLGSGYLSDDASKIERKNKESRQIHFDNLFSNGNFKDSTDMEMKEKFKLMLKESRKNYKENKGKQQLLFPFISISALPPHSSRSQRSLSGVLREDIADQQGYGTLQRTTSLELAEGGNALYEGYTELCDLSNYQTDSPSCDIQNSESCSPVNNQFSGLPVREEGDGSTMEIGCKDNPTLECYGSVTAAFKIVSSNVISVNVVSLQGLPCRQGQDNGLTLELKICPGGSSVWLPYPLARGSKITVNSDISMKLPPKHQKMSSSPAFHNFHVQISVWVAGRTWKHCSIGNAILSLSEAKEVPSNVGLYQHSKLTDYIGKLEVGLSSSADDSANISVKKTTDQSAALTIHILKAIFNKNLTIGKSFTAIRQLKRSKRDIWCRISLWSKGRRVERMCTSRIYLPVTNDPNFRTTASFHVLRCTLPYTSIVIKIMCDRGLGEDVIGKLILGPHLYLGVSEGRSLPTALSHWGRALTHTGSATMWHKLYL